MEWCQNLVGGRVGRIVVGVPYAGVLGDVESAEESWVAVGAVVEDVSDVLALVSCTLDVGSMFP